MLRVNRPTLTNLPTVVVAKVSRSTVIRSKVVKQLGPSWAEFFASVASVLSLA